MPLAETTFSFATAAGARTASAAHPRRSIRDVMRIMFCTVPDRTGRVTRCHSSGIIGRVPTTTRQRSRARRSREEIRGQMIATARDLLRTRAYADLTIEDVMRPTGQGRTVFYRHFDDLPDLLRRASIEAIEELYEAMVVLSHPVPADHATAIRRALEQAVAVYERHGPLLRGVREAGAADEQLAAAGDALRRRFDDLTAQSLREMAGPGGRFTDVTETARVLTLMNESYLLDAFGRE